MAIVVVVCGKIEKLSNWNKNWYDSRYGPCDYDSGDKKTKRQQQQQQQKRRKKGGPKGPHAL